MSVQLIRRRPGVGSRAGQLALGLEPMRNAVATASSERQLVGAPRDRLVRRRSPARGPRPWPPPSSACLPCSSSSSSPEVEAIFILAPSYRPMPAALGPAPRILAAPRGNRQDPTAPGYGELRIAAERTCAQDQEPPVRAAHHPYGETSGARSARGPRTPSAARSSTTRPASRSVRGSRRGTKRWWGDRLRLALDAPLCLGAGRLHHLGREDSGGAVERRERLVEHRHVAAHGGLAVDLVPPRVARVDARSEARGRSR
jgi:hypothetical protein